MANALFIQVEKALPQKGNLVRNFGGLARNRTGVQGFAVLCVTTPPRGRPLRADGLGGLRRPGQGALERRDAPVLPRAYPC